MSWNDRRPKRFKLVEKDGRPVVKTVTRLKSDPSTITLEEDERGLFLQFDVAGNGYVLVRNETSRSVGVRLRRGDVDRYRDLEPGEETGFGVAFTEAQAERFGKLLGG